MINLKLKSMKLPKSINPCPIREAVAGIRFESDVPADAIFGIIYQILQKEFGEVNRLPILDLPAEIRNADKDLVYQPYYRLENKNSAVLIGPKMFAVGLRGAYPGWQVHSEQIKNIFNKVQETGVFSKVNRMGLRYINFFQIDIFSNLELKIMAEDKSMDGEETLFRTVLSNEHCKSRLQIQKGVALAGKPTETGSIIDIDLFKTDMSGEFVKEFENFLEKAHIAEKELFFGLLKPEFLKTFNPVYEN